jgi:DNA-binding phage protein
MGKVRTSTKQETFTQKLSQTPRTEKNKHMENIELKEDDLKTMGIKKHFSGKFLRNKRNIGEAVLECLLNNDSEGVMEMIEIYLEEIDRSNLRKKSNLHKSTLHSVLKHRNPTIKTLAKIMYDYTKE